MQLAHFLDCEAIKTSLPGGNKRSLLQQLASRVRVWPHFSPATHQTTTVFDVALADSVVDHIRLVRQWATGLWSAWSAHHSAVAQLVAEHIAIT